jgi:hypothetical protein
MGQRDTYSQSLVYPIHYLSSPGYRNVEHLAETAQFCGVLWLAEKSMYEMFTTQSQVLRMGRYEAREA